MPRRDKARFRQRATFTMILAATQGAALAVYAAANGYADFTPVMIAIAFPLDAPLFCRDEA